MANRTITPAKVAAIVCSLTLLTLYVMAQSGYQLLPGTKSSRAVKDGQFVGPQNEEQPSRVPAPQETAQPSPILMSGSKVLVPAIAPAPASQPSVTSEYQVFSGSKSKVPIVPAISAPPAASPRLLPGSKGGIVTLNPTPPVTSPAGTAAPNSGTLMYGDGHVDFRLLPGSKSAARVIDPNIPVFFGDGHDASTRPATQP